MECGAGCSPVLQLSGTERSVCPQTSLKCQQTGGKAPLNGHSPWTVFELVPFDSANIYGAPSLCKILEQVVGMGEIARVNKSGSFLDGGVTYM